MASTIPALKSEDTDMAAAGSVAPAKAESGATVKPKSERSEKETQGNDEDDKAAALKQLEFYFSDSNLPYDKFMWTLHTKDPKEHWVPIPTVASFKRMQPFKKYDVAWMAGVLKTSPELLEVDSTGTKVRRALPLVPPGNAQHERSVYAKGFPDETPGLQQKVEKFFEGFAPINGVRMRRKAPAEGRTFKNSVFCEFRDKSGAESFLNASPPPSYEDKPLLIYSKDAYVTMKAKEHGFAPPDPTKILAGNVKRGFNAWKLMEEESGRKGKGKAAVADAAAEEAEPELTVDVEGNSFVVREDGTVDPEQVKYPEGRVLKYEGGGEKVDFKGIKTSLNEAGVKLLHIEKDYEGGNFSTGVAIFEVDMGDAQLETVKRVVPSIGDQTVTWTVASEDEERSAWTQRINFIADKRLSSFREQRTRGRGRGGRGGRGARGGGGGGRGGSRGGRGGNRGGGGSHLKRKRDETPTGVTPAAVPVVQATTKKPKLDDTSAAPA